MKKAVWVLVALLALATTECVPAADVPASNVTNNAGGTTGDNSADQQAPAAITPASLVQPADFEYLGAFRLPPDGERPAMFAYGGNAMTFNPSGDASGSQDGFPGTLFVMGHDRLPYGELPNGNQIAEISIPAPSSSRNISDLPQATFVQPLANAARGLFMDCAEIPRVGMAYLSTPATGPKLHLAWGQHLPQGEERGVPTHAWIDTNLSAPNPKGTWCIGNQSSYCVNGFTFEIPAAWADAHVGGRYLATGRFRDGGLSGQGPALFAYRPWVDDKGTPAPPGARLEEKVLLLYQDSRESEDVVNHSLRGYQHPDEWEGGAWLTTTTGKAGVLFAGTKSVGEKYWYGWVNPAGPTLPCVETEMIGQFPLCRLADGSVGSQEDLAGCEGHNDYRGWWSSRFEAQFIVYSPDDLAKVASGEMEPWQPQPYAVLSIDDRLFHNPAHVEEDMIGKGVQRRFRIGDVAYDRAHDLVYVLELYADEARPVVHVWRTR